MAVKTFFVLCAQTFLLQMAYSQCLGRFGHSPFAGPLASPFAASLSAPVFAAPGLAYDACGVSSTGGGFPVTSASPIAPTGVSVLSENEIKGELIVDGNLPLLGSVALEGAFSTAGAGAVSYGCGNGEITIVSESPIATGILTPGPVAPAPAIGSIIRPGFPSAVPRAALAAPKIPSFRGARAGKASVLRRGCL